MDFNYIDSIETKESIVVWCRDLKGVLFKEELPVSDYLYCFIPSNTEEEMEWKDIYGTPLKKISFDSKWDLREYTKERDNLCESDVQPSYKVLLDLFAEAPKDAPQNVMFYDIENDFDLSDGRGYPLPSNPFAPINSFQFYNSSTDSYGIVYVCEDQFRAPVDPDGKIVKMYRCRDEKELLLKVSDLLDTLDVDILAGWNTNGYDLPMLIARSTICFGETYAKKMFCRDGFSAKSREFIDDFGNDAVKWTLIGRQHLDMLELYKKFIPSEKKSFSLSNVCLEDLGVDKVDFDGDLGELYRKNPEKFYEYSFWDGKLLKMLDDKHQIIKLAVTLARMNCVKPVDVTGAVKPIEHGIMKFAHRDKIALPDKVANTKAKFEGAIVYDTVAGRTGWGFTIDLSALYPSTMMMLGLSPETMVMQLKGEYEDYIKVMSKSEDIVEVGLLERGKVKEWLSLPAFEVEAIIRENGYTISGIGVVFDGSFGLLSRYVKNGIELRNTHKKLMKEAQKAGNAYEAELNDLYQRVVKIGNNSVYGATGEASFRLYDLRLSRSITVTSRIISKHQAIVGNHLLREVSNDV